jgi:selenocysteine lyase/cysteine desulfurase
MLGIHALSASLSLLLEVGMDNVERRVLERSAKILTHIRNFPYLNTATPESAGRYGGIVTFNSRNSDSDALYRRLLDSGVLCAQRGGGVRFSPHFYTPMEKIEKALSLLS